MNKIVQSNQKLANCLFHSQIQIHIYHLQTRSFAQHKALEVYYTTIDALLDKYIETFQGKYGILQKYKSIEIDNNPQNCIQYLQGLNKIVLSTQLGKGDSELKNIKDEINELINSTLYKLQYLS